MRSIKEMDKRLDEREEEIERLAKEVEKLEKVNKMLLNSMVTEAHTKETKEIERLNNIINEIYIKALDTSITSLDLRDYIISSLGSDKE